MALTESVRSMLDGLFPDLLVIEFVEVNRDRVVGSFIVRPDMCTLGGVLHGGALMSLADTSGAVGAFVNLPQGARTSTMESKTNFLGAARAGSRITGESTPVHLGKLTMSVADPGEIREWEAHRAGNSNTGGHPRLTEFPPVRPGGALSGNVAFSSSRKIGH